MPPRVGARHRRAQQPAAASVAAAAGPFTLASAGPVRPAAFFSSSAWQPNGWRLAFAVALVGALLAPRALDYFFPGSVRLSPREALCARDHPPHVCAHGGMLEPQRIAGHEGGMLSAGHRLNTLRAFEHASRMGIRCVELDASMSRDGVPVRSINPVGTAARPSRAWICRAHRASMHHEVTPCVRATPTTTPTK